MIDQGTARAGDGPLTDIELRELLAQARAQDDQRLVRLVTSYLMLRRVTADVIAGIEAREGGASVARNPLLLRARQLSSRSSPSEAP